MDKLIAYLLASWRLSRMLYDLNEAGPFDILHKIRDAAGVKGTDDSGIAQLITCPYCVSVWVGLLFAVLSLNEKAFRLVVWPFAASGFVVQIRERLEHD